MQAAQLVEMRSVIKPEDPASTMRFIKNCRNPRVKSSGQLDYSKVNEAELWFIKNLQASAFKEEIDALAKGGISKKG
ncbi:hypothetical protein TNCT_319751 [Trichonephila clavata]|uniref:Uncharacterized protein n=1 Tax=Trichonephila clavata TaxID=2740835 RepID=A0A8X6GX69_TRICU|nr:hypothetical protein TNCT_319751 [Trichonephila clavata]